MSRAVLLSIKPKYCELIASGRKTMELRKARPKLETPFKCYIYCTKAGEPLFDGNIIAGGCKKDKIFTPRGVAKKDALALWDALNGKVIGEFVCDEIQVFHYGIQTPEDARSWQDCYKGYSEDLYFMDGTMLSGKEIDDYGAGKFIYTWNISDLVIYDKPKELSEFRGLCKYMDRDCGACPYYDYNIMDCKGRTITRPPQSWMYVEELT